MIILRQKKFSTGLGRTLYKMNKVKDAVAKVHKKSGLSSIGNKLEDAGTQVLGHVKRIMNPNDPRVALETRRVATSPTRVPRSAARRAVASEHNILSGIAQAKTGVENAMLQPGQAINAGVEATIRNPVTVTTGVAGKVTMLTDPLGAGKWPIGGAGLVAEQGMKKAIPAYARVTEKLGNAYHNSKVARVTSKIPSVPRMVQGAKTISAGMGIV